MTTPTKPTIVNTTPADTEPPGAYDIARANYVEPASTQVDLESLTLGQLADVSLETLVKAAHVILIRATELADRSLEDACDDQAAREDYTHPKDTSSAMVLAEETLKNLRCALTDLRCAYPRSGA